MTDPQPSAEWRETSRGTLLAGAPEMRAAPAVLDRVAASDCTVLVTGESGTGKELAVPALHDASERRHGALVAVSCGAVPENLVESELFGHVRGAFTGASRARKGFIAAAVGGTLFLDEIGERSLTVQVKLLRLLQSKEYNVVGESKPTRSNARIVAATNRDLAAEVRAGRFREDLCYRLDVIQVELPPRRKRRQGIERLATHFLERSAHRLRREVYGLSRPALERIVGSAGRATSARSRMPSNVRCCWPAARTSSWTTSTSCSTRAPARRRPFRPRLRRAAGAAARSRSRRCRRWIPNAAAISTPRWPPSKG